MKKLTNLVLVLLLALPFNLIVGQAQEVNYEINKVDQTKEYNHSRQPQEVNYETNKTTTNNNFEGTLTFDEDFFLAGVKSTYTSAMFPLTPNNYNVNGNTISFGDPLDEYYIQTISATINKEIDFNRPFVFQGESKINQSPDGFSIAMHNTPNYDAVSVGYALSYYDNSYLFNVDKPTGVDQGLVFEIDPIDNDPIKHPEMGGVDRFLDEAPNGRHLAVQETNSSGVPIKQKFIDNLGTEVYDDAVYDFEWNPKTNVFSVKYGNLEKIEYPVSNELANKLKSSPGYISVSASLNYDPLTDNYAPPGEGNVCTDNPSILKVNHLIYTDGPIQVPGEDGEQGTGDEVIVTPGEGEGELRPNPDGSVELPEQGGTITPGGGNGNDVNVPGGSIVNPDGSVELPGGGTIKPTPDGGVELPGQDGELDAPGNVDNPVVTPGEGGNTTVNPDGTVTVPDTGGNVTFPNNPDNNGTTTIPGGSTVKPDGTVETPEGGIVRPNPDGGVELPGNDGNLEAPDNVDNPVVTPGGDGNTTVNPDGSVTLPEGGDITYPNNPDYPGGSIIVPPGSVVNPDGSVTLPNGDKVDTEDNGTIILPGQDDNFGTDDDVIVTPEGDATIKPDGSVDLPNGGDITFPNKPEAGMEVPGGSNVGQDGTVTSPNGDQSRPNVDGTITVPGHDEEFGTDDDGIIYPTGPNKPVLNPDGTITIPEGGVIKFPGLGDCEIEILPGGYVDCHGVVYNPIYEEGSTVTRANNLTIVDWDVIDPAVVCAVNVSVGDILTNTGVGTTIAMLVAVVGLATLALFINRNRK